jgi:hypothetical protein
VLLVHAVMIVLVAGQALALALDEEKWPFSPYPMYSYMRNPVSYNEFQVWGVTPEGREFPLVERRHIRPLTSLRLREVVSRRVSRLGDREAAHDPYLREVVAGAWSRYEARRLETRHDGPPLVGARLYGVRWRLDPWVRNLHRPEERELVLELAGPSPAGR